MAPNDDLERVLASPSGAVFVGPHLGNWEAGLMGLPFTGLAPLYGIAKPAKNRPLSRHVQRQRERTGTWILGRHGAFSKSVRVLRAGAYLAMVTDQRARINPVIVPFFGRPAWTEQAPAVLLLRRKVPLVIGACLALEGRRFELVFTRTLWPDDWAGRSVAAVTTEIMQTMEELIRAHPEQYVWIHDRYYKAPAELPPEAEGARSAARGLRP